MKTTSTRPAMLEFTPSTPPRGGPPAHLSSLVKPTGAACNLDCTYCFFLSKDLLYDASSQKMSPQNMELYLRNFLGSQPDGDVAVEWQGGEPTMRGIDFFREAVQLADRWARPRQNVRHSLQTNGTLLNEEWGQFLSENNFLVGLSMDGPAELHDIYRVNRAQRATHQQVLRGWNILRDYGVDTNILCTIHAANQDHPLDVYRYFRDILGAQFIQFIPIVERTGSAELPYYHQGGVDVTERSVEPEKWGSFLTAIFNEWRNHDVGEVFVQGFDGMVANALGIYALCVHAPVCGDALAVLPSGDIYACDHYVEQGYDRGNIADIALQDVVRLPEQRAFGTEKQTRLPPECLSCDVRWACHGGCPKDRFVGSQTHPLNYLCAGYKSFFRHAAPTVKQIVNLIEAGRPASDIMPQRGLEPHVKAVG